MDYSKESQDRMKKIQDLKDAGVIPYANNYRGKINISEIRKRSENDTEGGYLRDIENLMAGGAISEFQTAGRIIASKSHGKLTFAKIRDNTADIQVCFMRDLIKFNTGREVVETISIAGEEKSAYKIAEKFCQVGDYIGVKGDLFETKHGELTIFVTEIQILSKAVRPLPEKWHGIQDQETIYRQRYLDLIMNNESFDRFKFRSQFIKAVREFYWKHDFTEIETPILWNSASGAAAQPFITHHNDFDDEFFLRIAPEIGLKMATVGRFERVFEMGKNFRNEGSDPSHMQEFSVFEHYAAYWNFEDNMKFTEDMFDYIFDSLKLKRKREIIDKDGNARTVDFTTPWKRIDYIAGVKEKSGIDIEAYTAADEDTFRADIQAAGYKWEGMEKQATATMIDYLYKKVLRPSITGPAFVYNYPKTMQPLARQSDADENIVEQFQLVLNGWEVLKAYSELVDPKIQQANFDEQSGALEAGDEEATSGDDDFVLSMEYGMPCQSGWGMGIDRIVSLLTAQENLRDVVLFPLMKSDNNETRKSEKTQVAVCILSKDANLEKWQQLNTVGHLTASLAGRKKHKELFFDEHLETQDNEKIKFNIEHAIVIKEAADSNALKKIESIAEKGGLETIHFTRTMIETSDDKKLKEVTKEQNYDDIELLGVLLFGDKKHVEKLTADLELLS